MERWDVGVLIFDDVEVLDFAGPYEVFSRTRLVPGVQSRRLSAPPPAGAETGLCVAYPPLGLPSQPVRADPAQPPPLAAADFFAHPLT